MKKLTILSMTLMMALSFAGCKDNPVEKYGTGLVTAKKQAENAATQANLTGLQQSVQSFRAMNGRYPESLEELQTVAGMDVDISQYNYDPATGQISLK